MRLSLILTVALLLGVTACSRSGQGDAPQADPQGPLYPDVVGQLETLPAMRWDHRPNAADWTSKTLASIQFGHAQALTDVVPRDIGQWCAAYPANTKDLRAMFWVGLLSAMAKYESTWNPAAVGGGGQWFGLVQISPATARGYGCGATSGAALQDGVANLSCAARIMAHTVPRDGVVAEGMRGVAADWGPFHNAAKRAEMAAWTSSQSYCR